MVPGCWNLILIVPSSVGENTFNIDSLKAIADFCWQNNLQLCVHAIGDRANREVINIYAGQIAKDKNKDHRWRVEHAQHVNPLEIPAFQRMECDRFHAGHSLYQ